MNEDKDKSSVADELHQSLDDFTSHAGDVPESASQKLMGVRHKISDELRLSRRRFVFVYIMFSLVGYIASLSLCSQNAFMFRFFSVDIAILLHQLPDPWCPITCGLFFSAPPVLFIVMFLDRFQLKRVLHELWWLPIVTVLIACALMTLLPENLQHEGMTHVAHGHLRDTRGDVQWLVWWTFAAVLNPVVLILANHLKARLRKSL